VDARAISELRAIAAEAREGVDKVVAGNDLAGEDRYRTLQCRAAALNAEYEWASPEEFETLFPTPAARREIDALNERYGVGRSGEDEGDSSIQDLLVGLWAWARGVLVPYEHGIE
jgi:hypothetical protein